MDTSLSLASVKAEFALLDASRYACLLEGRRWPSPLWRKWHRLRSEIARLRRRQVEYLKPEALN